MDWEPAGKGRAKAFLPPYPADFQIYLPHIAVAGLSFRKDEALSFANSQAQTIELERKPGNRHDKNAIRVIGVSKHGRAFIGYIPKEVTAHIARSNMFDILKPRLGRIYEASSSPHDSEWNGHYLEVMIQIIGPKVAKAQFDEISKLTRRRKAIRDVT